MKKLFFETLKWDRLQQNQCPKCGKDLMYDDYQKLFTCQCSFRISMARFKQIIESRVEQSIDNKVKWWKKNNHNY